MIDLFDSIEEAIQDNMQEDKQESQEEATADASEVAQSEDDDIDKMIEEQEEYEDLEIMLSHNYGLKLPENITDERLEKIKSLVFEWHDFPFEEEKHQIESLIMDATDASEQEEVKQEAIDFNTEKEETIQEVKQVETIQDNMQEDKQESQQEATADASEEAIQEIEIKTPNKNSIAIEESQEDKEKQSIFKDYLKTIIPIQDFATQESDDSIVFNFTIKKADLMAFKQPLTYSSYEHSLKIKKGQEEARKEGRTPGVKRGSKRERADKQPLIEQIKKLSNSFNGAMNNHELAKELNCSLNRICNYKRQIKQQLKNRD